MLSARRLFAAILAIGSLAAPRASQPSTGPLEALYRAGQWFELRTLVTERDPELIRGAVAAAFNDYEGAERLLRRVIRSAPKSDAADQAYAILCRTYVSSAQYRRLVTTYREWAAAFPSSELRREQQNSFELFGGRPDQINGPTRAATARHDDDSFSVPVSINGKTDDFLLDTGAAHSVLTDREAKKFGLTVSGDTKVGTGASGDTYRFRTAVAKEVTLGSMTFRNVSFAVITPGGAFADVEAGIIGLPIILAIGGINWSHSGTAEFGGTLPASSGEPNLVFDRSRLVVRAEVLGKRVLASFDTGANSTELNANFADQFPDAVAGGKKGSAELNGIGGTQTFASVELPELIFTIGSRPVPVRPAVITMQRNGTAGGECCIANAGNDLLKHGQGFVLNLSAMTLQLR